MHKTTSKVSLFLSTSELCEHILNFETLIGQPYVFYGLYIFFTDPQTDFKIYRMFHVYREYYTVWSYT